MIVANGCGRLHYEKRDRMDDESGTSAGVMFLGLDHFGQSAIPSLSTAFGKFYPCVNWWFCSQNGPAPPIH